MGKTFFKISSIIIYIFYAYLLVWQIFYGNRTDSNKWETQNSEIIIYGYEEVLFNYLPTLVLLLFSFLLYGHIIFSQRKAAIFSSFFASSILSIHDKFYFMALALLVFGLVIAFFELRKTANDSIEK